MPEGYDQLIMEPNTVVEQCRQCGALVMTPGGRQDHNNFHAWLSGPRMEPVQAPQLSARNRRNPNG